MLHFILMFTIIADTVVSQDPVASWKFTECNGGNDIYGLNDVTMNGVTYGLGPEDESGGSAYLPKQDGESMIVDDPTPLIVFAATDALTLYTHVYIESFSFIPANIFTYQKDTNPAANLFINNKAIWYDNQVTGDVLTTAGTWYEIAKVYNNGVFTIYVDGVEVHSVTASKMETAGVIQFGRSQIFPVGDGYDARIACASLYNTALNAAQVAALKCGEPVQCNISALDTTNMISSNFPCQVLSGESVNVTCEEGYLFPDVGTGEHAFRCDASGNWLNVDTCHECKDDSDCASDEHSFCNTTVYECQCVAGWQTHSKVDTCVDADECLYDITNLCWSAEAGNPGVVNCSCVNLHGTYECRCPVGYDLDELNGGGHNIDETQTDNCGCEDGCNDRIPDVDGGLLFECNCDNLSPFYELSKNKLSCIDVDECTNASACTSGSANQFGSHTGTDEQSRCVNTHGGYHCECSDGYELDEDGSTCNVDECLFDFANNCWSADAGSTGVVNCTCVNLRGTFECHCPAGYHLDDLNGGGHNIDETQTDNCGCEGGCDDRIPDVDGGLLFECNCDNLEPFYQLSENKLSCIDVDECTNASTCASGSANLFGSHTGADEQARCVNTHGGYRCECSDGYEMDEDGSTCNDIDECDAANGGCQHTCTNSFGSRTCTCRNGWTLHSNNADCYDTDECLIEGNCIDGVCVNSPGAYECFCEGEYAEFVEGKRVCSGDRWLSMKQCYLYSWDDKYDDLADPDTHALKSTIENGVGSVIIYQVDGAKSVTITAFYDCDSKLGVIIATQFNDELTKAEQGLVSSAATSVVSRTPVIILDGNVSPSGATEVVYTSPDSNDARSDTVSSPCDYLNSISYCPSNSECVNPSDDSDVPTCLSDESESSDTTTPRDDATEMVAVIVSVSVIGGVIFISIIFSIMYCLHRRNIIYNTKGYYGNSLEPTYFRQPRLVLRPESLYEDNRYGF